MKADRKAEMEQRKADREEHKLWREEESLWQEERTTLLKALMEKIGISL